MAIKLIKACKELNIGMATLTAWCEKNGHSIESDPNVRIDDDLYLLLAKEFNKDQAMKIEAERQAAARAAREAESGSMLPGTYRSHTLPHSAYPLGFRMQCFLYGRRTVPTFVLWLLRLWPDRAPQSAGLPCAAPPFQKALPFHPQYQHFPHPG